MKRLLSVLVVMGAAGAVVYGADPVVVSPDVPKKKASGANLGPNWIVRYVAAGPLWVLELAVPGSPAPNVDAVHMMDAPGDWLFSIEVPNDLAGALPNPAWPGDVIWFDSSVGTYSTCFSASAAGLSPRTNVDSVYMVGGDQGDLYVSFDVHTDIGGFVGPTAIEPADIVRFTPAGPGVCPGWVFAGLAYDASAAGTGIANSSNVGGADEVSGGWILAFDVPTDLSPPALTVASPQIVFSDTLTFNIFEGLIGWPISSEVAALSCLANPGRIPATLMLGKSTITPGDLTLVWQTSCSQGGEDYGIYEGTIGTWYSHNAIDCNDGAPALTEEVTPAGGDRYYLLVPHSQTKEEGSYGTDDILGVQTQRPPGGAPCSTTYNPAPCP